MIDGEEPLAESVANDEQPRQETEPAETARTMDVAPVAKPAAIPVVEAERITNIDILRGFALMGVLLMNMQAFAMPFCAYMNPTAYGSNNSLNFALWCINHVVAEGKFITIFSMLFGAGIVLMTSRARERAGRSARVHYRRMLWLLIFGVLHGVLLWHGDILLFYAICGMIAYLFRRRGVWLLVILSLVFIGLPTLMLAGLGSYMESAPAEETRQMLEMWAPDPDTIAEKEAAFRGAYMDHLPVRYEAWVSMFGFLAIFGWRVLGVMLLGMAMLKLRVLSGSRSSATYATLAVAGFLVGMPLAILGIRHQVAHGWDMVEGMGIGSLYNYVGSLFVAFAWIGVIMLICRTGRLTSLTKRFAAVGRMAFTNYIMHSVICTTLFYGHGFGLFGRIDRAGQLGIVLLIASFQLWYSPIWLSRFRFGPLEWLWRTLTYWKAQPFRRIPVLST